MRDKKPFLFELELDAFGMQLDSRDFRENPLELKVVIALDVMNFHAARCGRLQFGDERFIFGNKNPLGPDENIENISRQNQRISRRRAVADQRQERMIERIAGPPDVQVGDDVKTHTFVYIRLFDRGSCHLGDPWRSPHGVSETPRR